MGVCGKSRCPFLRQQDGHGDPWPPDGRWAAGYGAHDEDVLSWVPKSTAVVGKVAYIAARADIPNWRSGFALAVASATSKDAAYLFFNG
ncbi:MAG: hypothetical protein U1E67_21630 [Hyphomicrobiales bacterium]